LFNFTPVNDVLIARGPVREELKNKVSKRLIKLTKAYKNGKIGITTDYIKEYGELSKKGCNVLVVLYQTTTMPNALNLESYLIYRYSKLLNQFSTSDTNKIPIGAQKYYLYFCS